MNNKVTKKEKIKSIILMTLCGFGVICLAVLLMPNRKKVTYPSIVLPEHLERGDTSIILPNSSVTLDYPTDTIYIHDTIYLNKK